MRKIIFIVLVLAFSTMLLAQSLEEINWITEEYPPYNFSENGQLKGIAVDILIEMWKRAGLNKKRSDINVYPWARGVNMVKTKPGTCLFSTTITAERKNVFGWKFVYPVPQTTDESNNHIIAKKSANIEFNSMNDLKEYGKSFGVVRGDVGTSLLAEAGVGKNKHDEAANPKVLVKKFAAGRYDVISYGFVTASFKMKELGINPDDYEVVFTFPNKPMGFAFHHNTDPELLKKLQKALDSMHSDGTAEKIRSKYIEK